MSTSKSMAHTKDLVVSTRQCIKVRSGRTYCLHQWIGNAWNIGANGSKSEQDTRKLNKTLVWWGLHGVEKNALNKIMDLILPGFPFLTMDDNAIPQQMEIN